MAVLAAPNERTEADAGRKRRMELLAQADPARLESALEALVPLPENNRVRGPETGIVMVRGRIGGGGDPFNLGEATVSRATVRLATGEIGFGQVLGLSLRHAELAAILDAAGQSPAFAAEIDRLVEAIAIDLAESDAAVARQTAATRVDFFTLVRGED